MADKYPKNLYSKAGLEHSCAAASSRLSAGVGGGGVWARVGLDDLAFVRTGLSDHRLLGNWLWDGKKNYLAKREVHEVLEPSVKAS